MYNILLNVSDECEQLSAPSSGSFDIESIGITSVVSYECDVGTTLVGDTSRTCQQDTTWTLSAPTCSEYAYCHNSILISIIM